MIKLGIIGYPLKHSLSPAMQNAMLKAKGIEGEYIKLETPPEELSKTLEYLKDNDFKGFNVTIPYKVPIISYLDEIDSFAKAVGAVNTVVIDFDKRLSGYNTDVYGFINAIPEEKRKVFCGKSALITGSGGAARAVSAGIAEMGFYNLVIATLAEELDKAEEIKLNIQKNFSTIEIQCVQLDENLDLRGNSLVVNTTPLGMEGKFENLSPLSKKTLMSAEKNALIYDIVYKPSETVLLRMASELGLSCMGGIDMLVLQGARAFKLWTEEEPSVPVMKNALYCSEI